MTTEAAEDPQYLIVRQAVSLLPAWRSLSTKVELLNSSSRCVFKVSNSKRACETLCVRLLRPGDEQLTQTIGAIAASGLGLPVLAANSMAIVQPWLQAANLNPAAIREPTTVSRLGQFVASLHAIPIDGPVAPKARANDLVSFANDLVQKQSLSVLAAQEFIAELDQICTVLASLSQHGNNCADQRLVWTHGSLSLDNLLEDSWPANMVPVYEGTISHPALGHNAPIRVQLDSAMYGRWQAFGTVEDVLVSAGEGQIVFYDVSGRTRLIGIAPSSDCIRGEVIQDGVRGGNFVLIGLPENNREQRFKAIDLEMAGRRSAGSDISYFFLTWGLADGVQYPSLEIRRAFVQAYLNACGLPADRISVDGFLWGVECESLLQVAWLGLAATATSSLRPQPQMTQLALQLFAGLPAARGVVAEATRDLAARTALLERGAFGVR